jgi:hypothetical protein
MQDDAARELDIERPQTKGAPRGNAYESERLVQKSIESFAAAGASAQLKTALPELGVVQALEFSFEVSDAANLQRGVSEPAL